LTITAHSSETATFVRAMQPVMVAVGEQPG
jgi:hypothetical protein